MPTHKTPTSSPAGSPATVVFVHPDLGIGGAERLVIDAAVGLLRRGHRVVIFTSYCDPAHCFDEARDGTLDVRVRGGWLVPRSVAGRLTVLCAILRQIHLILHVAAYGELDRLGPSYLFVDQLSAGLPLLRHVYPGSPILFYCHFPDLLLAHGHVPAVGRQPALHAAGAAAAAALQSRLSPLGRLYRLPFDALERWSMGFATAVAVNSAFTRSIVEAVWPSLVGRVDLRVVHPCVAPGVIDGDGDGDGAAGPGPSGVVGVADMWPGERVILSINRFERKKDVGLAIRAFAAVSLSRRTRARLVIAGGYDPRVQENIIYHRELESLADSLGLEYQTHKTLPSALAARSPVVFLHSVPTACKLLLLRRASLLVYTPANEHFGIVPLEAMAARVPVLAATTGGPTETVVDGVTGWLRDTDDVPAWSAVMGSVASGDISDEQVVEMGRAGAARVRDSFQRDAMAERLDRVLAGMGSPVPNRNLAVTGTVLGLVSLGMVFVFGLLFAQLWAGLRGAGRK